MQKTALIALMILIALATPLAAREYVTDVELITTSNAQRVSTGRP